MMSLRLLQKSLALALLDRTRAVPAGLRAPGVQEVARRFGVYRNNVFVSLVEALATRFPVCLELVGDDFFRAMARIYVELSPPRSPLLMTYGDDFGDFIDTFPPARSVPYLGDVARLEAARTGAYHAADAEPLGIDALAALNSCAWELTPVRLHPSVRVVRSRFSIVTIWEAHPPGGPGATIDGSVAEDALVVRPDLHVEVRRLEPGGAAFIEGLLSGASFGEAARKAGSEDPGFDLVKSLAGLITGRMIVGLDPPSSISRPS
jgi:Putative DNA-binding domain